MTTLTPVPEGFELDNPTVEERLLNVERELGLAPTLEDPLAQQTMLNRIIGLERRLAALYRHFELRPWQLLGDSKPVDSPWEPHRIDP